MKPILATIVFVLLAGTALPAADVTYLCGQGGELEKAGNLDGAIASYTACIDQHAPSTYMSRISRAYLYIRRGINADQAIAEINSIMSDSPLNLNDRNLLYFRGKGYLLKGMPDQALADFARVKGSDSFAEPHDARGRILNGKGQYEQALAEFNTAVKLTSATPNLGGPKTDNQPYLRAYCGRAESFLALHRWREAADDYQHCLPATPDPGQKDAVVAEGLAWYKLGEREKAQANAKKLVEWEPRLEVSFGGDHAIEVFDFDKRRAITRAAMESASAFETAGNWTAAFEAIERAHSYVSGYLPEDRALPSTVANAFMRLYPKLTVKPALPESARRLQVEANTYVRDKQLDKAVQAYFDLLLIAPWFPDAYFNIGMILGEGGNYQSAIDYMNGYLKLLPNAPDRRVAQDKIYEWQAKVK